MSKKRKNSRRANGQGTLEKKPNGIYMARWIKNGKSFSRSTKTRVREEAEKILASLVKPFQEEDESAVIENLKAEIRKMENRLAEKERLLPALKISDALDAYFNDVNVSKVTAGTKKLYGEMMRRLERFVEGCGDKSIVELREITPTIVKSYLKDLKGKFKGATYNRYLKFYKRVWRILQDEARLTCNPWLEYKNQIVDVVPRRNLTIEELTKVIGSLDGEWKGLFVLGAYTGMRIRDCSHLDWKDVKDFRYVTPDVSATKIVYALLILQRAASFGGKSISMFRKHRLSDAGRIAENSLDELAAKLAAGTMSAEEFKSVPFIFAVSERSYYKSGFFQPDRTVEKLWRARRMECRAAQSGAEDGPE